ncbi:MAG TPA: nitroreductase family deazaflavin-dependent oxidoreductase [Pseudonocardia sp.]|jgi:deazaflavin-dependent oxidoreductase (nitroreductase family)|nr:nitroreductase family deazaflavin-dependent oxidoreductase [Pseudonocardia sp.]
MDLSRIEQIGAVKAIGIRMLAVHQLIYERTGGRIGHRVLGVPCLLLHTVGAKTGQPRVSGLVYARDGQDYLVVASNGGASRAPGWYHNLLANPDAQVQVGTASHHVTAHAVHPGDATYERLWDAVNKANHNRYRAYQRATDRPIPIVALSPNKS